jgi:MFS family permease
MVGAKSGKERFMASDDARVSVAAATADAAVASAPTADWSRASVYTLFFLTLVTTLNYFDRSALALVLPLIKKDMGLSDTALGVVSSVVLVYAVVGVPVAMLADRWSRRNIIAIGFAFWSAMTALTGLAANVWQLGLARLLMGVGESCGVAPSNSMLSDLFSKKTLPTALGIFTCGASVAFIVYSPIAGLLADRHGWRSVFFAFGIFGVALALIFFLTVKEPPRAADALRDKAGFGETLRFLSGSAAFWLLILGGGFMGVYLYGRATWGATFLIRVHDFSIMQIGTIFEPVRGAISAVGIVAGGMLATWLTRHGERWLAFTPAAACLLLAPFEAMFVFADARPIWITGFAAGSLFSIMYLPPAYAGVMAVARPRMRATAVSIYLLSATLIGQLAGPILIGRLNDVLDARFGALAIRYSLGVVILCAALGGLCFLAGGFFMARDVKRTAA